MDGSLRQAPPLPQIKERLVADNKPTQRLMRLLAKLYAEGALEDKPEKLTKAKIDRALAAVAASPKLLENIKQEIANSGEGTQNEMIERAHEDWTEAYGKPSRFGRRK